MARPDPFRSRQPRTARSSAEYPGRCLPDSDTSYNDNYMGWPVNPQHAQHPVRGSFLDPRGEDDTGLSGYHFGIDISVDDHQPEPGAPSMLSHRVYALESGTVSASANVLTIAASTVGSRSGTSPTGTSPRSCTHASTSRPGSRSAGPASASGTCTSPNGSVYRGKLVWVNPLHRAGHLGPYTDTGPPVVHALTFVTPPARPWLPTVSLAQPDSSTRLQPNNLHGLVELRANIDDPQSFLGFLNQNPAWLTNFAPYRVTVEIRSTGGRTVMSRTSFKADQLPQTPFIVHYAPGTIEDDNMQECVGPPALPNASAPTGSGPSPASNRSTGTPAPPRTARTR